MADAHFDPEIYRRFFGAETEDDIQFADELLDAIGKIDRALVPRSVTHPYIDHIRAGKEGIAPLLSALNTPRDGTGRGDVLDALAYIFVNMPAPQQACNAIRPLLQDKACAGLAARTLAIGQDQVFLTDMLQGLASDDPGEIAASAMLMGYGRVKEAVPILIELLSPLRFFESRSVIWALGEIGDKAAMPSLERALTESFRTTDAMIAIGKIGALDSIHLLLPYILQGDTESREIGLRSLSMLLVKHRDDTASMAGLQASLSTPLRQIALEENSRTARFHALLCLARLGEKLKPNQLRKALDMSLSEDDMSAFQSFFVRKR